MRGVRLALVLALGVTAAGVGAAQQQRPVFRAAVDLVQLDVVVVDANGRPMRGLTQDDFTILDRGTARPVATFAEVAHEPAGALVFPEGVSLDVGNNQAATSERLVLLMVDDLHFRGRTDEVKALLRELVQGLGGRVSLGLVTTSGVYGVEVTDDRNRVLEEIDRFEDKYDNTRGGIRNSISITNTEGQPDLGYMSAPDDLGIFFGSITAYKVVEDVARMVGADDGRRKAFVWVSAGVEGAGGLSSMLAGRSCSGGDWTCGSLAGMLEKLRRSSVAVYAVHPGGPTDLGQSVAPLAEATGGFAVRPDELESGLKRVISDLDNYYLLGFYPEAVADRDFSAVEVRVNRPGATIRYRRGYSPKGAPDPPKNREPLTRLVAGVMPNTELPLRFTAVPLLTTGSDALVAVTLEVNLERLPDIAAGETFDDTLRYGVYAADLGKKKVTATKGRTLTMSWRQADADRPDGHRFLATNVLELRPGRYQFRVSALSESLDRSGSVYLQVDVPDPKADVAIGGLALSAAGREDQHPTIVDRITTPNWPLPFQPMLDRWFTPEDTLRLFFQVRRRSERGPASGVAIVRNAAGEEVRRQPFALGTQKLTAHDLQLPLTGLPSGAYAIDVQVTSGEVTAARRVGFIVNDVR